MYSVDIDVGGTLTDGIFSEGRRLVCVKVDSTPHDLTVCLFDCLTQGATQLGFADLTTLLEQVELLRWSTTITSNVLAELRGPKIGLMVSKGHERVLSGSDICQNTDDMTRTHYAVINAYTYSALAATLFKAEDELRYGVFAGIPHQPYQWRCGGCLEDARDRHHRLRPDSRNPRHELSGRSFGGGQKRMSKPQWWTCRRRHGR